MTHCTADRLIAHADALEHAAAVGGYIDDRTGQRVTLDAEARRGWALDAAVLREHALGLQHGGAQAHPQPEPAS